MTKKQALAVLALIAAATLCGLVTATPALAHGFAVGPPTVEVAVPGDGEGTAEVYVNSDFDGELVVDVEGMALEVQPGTIQIASTDSYEYVELTFHADEGLPEGTYSGKLTFLAYDGGNVAGGVKLDLAVTVTGGTSPAVAWTEGDGTEGGATGQTNPVIAWLSRNSVETALACLVILALVVGIVIGKGGRRRGEAKGAHARR
ncbi:MAG: hypothetical protein SVP26_06130 [Chloroflexota bacterium]|nr:hypothetical protein [Chloroflexota bacterium]